MTKYKYNDGDWIGPNKDVLLIKRLKTDNCHLKGLMICPLCGNDEWIGNVYSVANGKTKSCGCTRKKPRPNRIKDLTGKKFGHLTVKYLVKDKRTNSNGTIWHCVCDCKNKNEIDVSSDHLQRSHVTSCGCRTKSVGEEKIEVLLKKIKYKYETQKYFSNCKLIRPLPFDFYLPDYNCCIEYDGIQHFEEGHWESLKNIQQRDNIKNEYCKNNNIKLIRIPYTDFEKIDEEYILERIGDANG